MTPALASQLIAALTRVRTYADLLPATVASDVREALKAWEREQATQATIPTQGKT